MSEQRENEIRDALHAVIDPELGISVVDLGLVYGIEEDDMGNTTINITLTTPACPLTGQLEQQIQAVLGNICESVIVNWVWTPMWNMSMITEEGKRQLSAIGFNF
jgi:metal-sulfur cluster biosynthetic enzyme